MTPLAELRNAILRFVPTGQRMGFLATVDALARREAEARARRDLWHRIARKWKATRAGIIGVCRGLQRERDEARKEVERLRVYHEDDEPSWRHRAERLERERDELRALLREVEWRGITDDGGAAYCLFCHAPPPETEEEFADRKTRERRMLSGLLEGAVAAHLGRMRLRIGHAPDCRLAALLQPVECRMNDPGTKEEDEPNPEYPDQGECAHCGGPTHDGDKYCSASCARADIEDDRRKDD